MEEKKKSDRKSGSEVIHGKVISHDYPAYVVWEGVEPGVYTTWEEAKKQVDGFPNPKYKKFKNIFEAVRAFEDPFEDHLYKPTATPVF